MKFNKLFLLIVIVFVSCKKTINIKTEKYKVQNIEKKDTIQKISLKRQDSIIKVSLKKIHDIKYSKYMDEIYSEYKKKDTTFWIEGAEDLNTKEKIIYYSKSYHDKNNERNNYLISLLISNKNNILFTSLYSDRFSHKEGKDYDVIKDTFFFKNSKIYFWKNKQATKGELLKKEKEILAIKKEIDSVMEWSKN